MIDGDYDVFGDGSVRILKTPGHTPGHQSLQLRLKKAGTLIISGDLFHVRDNYRFRRVPPFNVERADTLASIDRVGTILRNTKGRLVVQPRPAGLQIAAEDSEVPGLITALVDGWTSLSDSWKPRPNLRRRLQRRS